MGGVGFQNILSEFSFSIKQTGLRPNSRKDGTGLPLPWSQIHSGVVLVGDKQVWELRDAEGETLLHILFEAVEPDRLEVEVEGSASQTIKLTTGRLRG